MLRFDGESSLRLRGCSVNLSDISASAGTLVRLTWDPLCDLGGKDCFFGAFVTGKVLKLAKDMYPHPSTVDDFQHVPQGASPRALDELLGMEHTRPMLLSSEDHVCSEQKCVSRLATTLISDCSTKAVPVPLVKLNNKKFKGQTTTNFTKPYIQVYCSGLQQPASVRIPTTFFETLAFARWKSLIKPSLDSRPYYYYLIRTKNTYLCGLAFHVDEKRAIDDWDLQITTDKMFEGGWVRYRQALLWVGMTRSARCNPASPPVAHGNHVSHGDLLKVRNRLRLALQNTSEGKWTALECKSFIDAWVPEVLALPLWLSPILNQWCCGLHLLCEEVLSFLNPRVGVHMSMTQFLFWWSWGELCVRYPETWGNPQNLTSLTTWVVKDLGRLFLAVVNSSLSDRHDLARKRNYLVASHIEHVVQQGPMHAHFLLSKTHDLWLRADLKAREKCGESRSEVIRDQKAKRVSALVLMALLRGLQRLGHCACGNHQDRVWEEGRPVEFARGRKEKSQKVMTKGKTDHMLNRNTTNK